MSLTATNKGGNRISPIEAGTHPAICYGLIDLGMQYNEKYKNSSQKVLIMWELPDEKIEIDGELKSRIISQTYTCSLNEKAVLRKDLASWRGRDFTDEELAAFDLRTIVGVPCLLSIIHKEYNGSPYANVGGIMKMPKGMPPIVQTMDSIIFDLDSSPLEDMDKLPGWIQKRIMASETYKERVDGAGDKTGDEASEYQNELTELEDDGELPF